MNVRNAKSDRASDDPATRSGNGNAREAAPEANAANEEQLADLERRLRETADSLKDSAKVIGDFASNQIRLHPLGSFGVAFFAGLTVARLLRR